MFVTQTDLADVFGVSTRTIQRWGGKGLDDCRTGPDATYDLAAAVAWRLGQEHQTGYDEGVRTASGDKKGVELRKEEALARRRELEVDVMEGRLVDVEEAEDDLAERLAGIRGSMLAFPGRLVPMLDRYKAEEALAIIEPIVHELMSALSEGRYDDSDEAEA